MESINRIKSSVAAAVGLLTGLWGWFGWMVVGWIVCMVLDYVTGSMAAAKEGDWSSAKAREGIWHKCGMIIVVIVAGGADLLIFLVLENMPVLALPAQYPGLVCPVVMVWYIITEMGSMAENAAIMGAPVPGWLLKLLALSKSAVDNAGDKLTGNEAESEGGE